MPKVNQPVRTPQTFKAYLETYEPTVLHGALVQLEGSIAWELLQSFLRQRQREFEIASLDLMGHTGKHQEAAKASGYAQACEDTANQFMKDMADMVSGLNGVVEGPTREQDI